MSVQGLKQTTNTPKGDEGKGSGLMLKKHEKHDNKDEQSVQSTSASPGRDVRGLTSKVKTIE